MYFCSFDFPVGKKTVKMRILLSNKFYYRRGGDCIVTMGMEDLLKSKGHEVAIFAMDYPENINSPWKKYWPSNMTKFKALLRPFGDKEVKAKFNQILDDFKPDIVHLHNIHTQLSPILAQIAHDRGINVFWTLHDTKLVCPCYTCYRDGKWCEECFSNRAAVIKHHCMPGSIPGAIIGYLEAKKWNSSRLSSYVTKFLPPSQFMADTCIRGGYDPNKFEVLNNFIDVKKIENPSFKKQDYYCFLGRVTAVKGICTLCKIASKLPYKLKVIGDGDLLEELQTKYPNIEFLGRKKWDEFRPVLEKARFMVIPSEWSENNPLTIIESHALGTPVLGARIGGIPELIEEGVSGMTFSSGNEDDLKQKIQLMFDTVFDCHQISVKAIERYSSETYYEKLMELYKSLM